MDRQSNKITVLYCRLAHYLDDMDIACGYMQMEQLLQYAREHNLENPQFFCDWGYSGTSSDRPEYQRMLREVVNRKVSNLVVMNISRLERDIDDFWKLVCDTFPHYDVEFHSIQDGNNITKPLGKFRQVWTAIMLGCRLNQEGGRM